MTYYTLDRQFKNVVAKWQWRVEVVKYGYSDLILTDHKFREFSFRFNNSVSSYSDCGIGLVLYMVEWLVDQVLYA